MARAQKSGPAEVSPGHAPGIVSRVGDGTRGALAGAVAALVWKATDPPFDRVFGTTYSDARLFGLAAHTAAGTAFGWAFARLGGRGVRQGAAAAVAEGIGFWPLMAALDRSVFADLRAFARSVAGHAVFGAVLGALVRGK